MAIIPIVRCSRMEASLAFYTQVLDFQLVDSDGQPTDPCFRVLVRDGALLFLSSHAGDGSFKTAIAVLTDNVDALVHQFRSRGLKTTGNPNAPTVVHEGPIDQTWGTREFYVNDPDSNTLRFIQGFRIGPVS